MSGSAMDDAIHELVIAVQPMTKPVASIFYLEYRYGSPKGPKLVQGWLFSEDA